MFDKNPLLILFLLALLSLKFLLIPMLEWQNDIVWELSQNSKRLSRSLNAINNIQKNEQHLEELENINKKVEALFYPYSDSSSFQLEKQQWLEKMVSELGLTVTNIGWSYVADVVDVPARRYRLDIGLSGPTSKIPELFLVLESQQQWIQVYQFSFSFAGQEGSDLGKVSGNVEVVFFQRLDLIGTNPLDTES